MSSSREEKTSIVTDSEKAKKYSYEDYGKTIFVGTIAATISRFATWNLEMGYYFKMQLPEQSYPQHYRKAFSKEALKQGGFDRTGFWQTLGKGFSNGATWAYFDAFHPNLSSTERVIYVTTVSTILETACTTNAEKRKVDYFANLSAGKTVHPGSYYFDPAFTKFVGITLARGFWSGIWTFGGIEVANKLITPWFPESMKNSAWISATSGLAGAMIAQPLIMPAITLQTEVFKNPTLPVSTIVGQFCYNKTNWEIIRGSTTGALGRALCNGPRYAFMLGLTKIIKSVIDSPPPTAPQTKSEYGFMRLFKRKPENDDVLQSKVKIKLSERELIDTVLEESIGLRR